MGAWQDLKGKKFGRWLVIGGFKRTSVASFWLCECQCGEKRMVMAGHLKAGRSRSCGCLSREISSRVKTTHGKSKTRIYKIWKGIRKRCLSKTEKAYVNYGGRGIKICSRWNSFENFLFDMGYPPSISHSVDRIDNDGHYCPENCRWVTDTEQANNKRTNKMLTIKGKRMTLAEASRTFPSLSYSTIRARLRAGWSDEQAVGLFFKETARIQNSKKRKCKT